MTIPPMAPEVRKLLEEIADRHDVALADMFRKSKVPAYWEARREAYYALRMRGTKWSFQRIADLFGISLQAVEQALQRRAKKRRAKRVVETTLSRN